MTRQDWLLLALSKARNGTFSPVQAQKAMFLIGTEAKRYVGDDFYAFEPYDYGPFSSSVYSDLETLASESKVEIRQVPGRRWSVYSITPEGRQSIDASAKDADPRATKYVSEVATWVSGLSFQQLVRAIYDKYPAYKANSIFKD